MFRREQEPEQGDINTISLKCFLCQGNWTGTNVEVLTDHLEKDHKVVFKIKELIELSQPGELESAIDTDKKKRLLADTKKNVDNNLGKKIC